MKLECKFALYLGKYTCTAFKASITEPSVDIVQFVGNHLAGRSNNDVTRVIFSNDKVEYFPRNLPKIFPTLDTLEIHNCELKEISREDLVGLEALVWLNLSSNHLKSLPDDLFSSMPNLKKVWLNYNKIEFASSMLIDPIVGNQLEIFTLRNNASIDESYCALDRHSGCRTIQELMEKIDENCETPESEPESEPEMRLKRLNEFRLRGRYTDFVISVGLREFPVNKNILAAQSSVLAEMLEVNTNGRSASKLKISDMSAEAVDAFLGYLYGCKQPDEQNAVELFKLAAKYEVNRLKAICEQIILDNLDESDAFNIFKLACGPHKSEKLKVSAFSMLQKMFELDDDLINNLEKVRMIIEEKKLLVPLWVPTSTEPEAKKQRRF